MRIGGSLGAGQQNGFVKLVICAAKIQGGITLQQMGDDFQTFLKAGKARPQFQ